MRRVHRVSSSHQPHARTQRFSRDLNLHPHRAEVTEQIRQGGVGAGSISVGDHSCSELDAEQAPAHDDTRVGIAQDVGASAAGVRVEGEDQVHRRGEGQSRRFVAQHTLIVDQRRRCDLCHRCPARNHQQHHEDQILHGDHCLLLVSMAHGQGAGLARCAPELVNPLVDSSESRLRAVMR